MIYNELTKFCLEKDIQLIAVSKTKPLIAIEKLYNLGQRNFGENRVQELSEKYDSLPKDINWHMIGHLQSNKVKYIAPFVNMIHSGANYSLLKEINKRAKQHQRTIDTLLQIKIGQEESKSGWNHEELLTHLADHKIQELPNIRIRGVMGMATFTSDKTVVRSEFKELKSSFDLIKNKYFSSLGTFDTISMGMSGDYQIAAEEGSTMVRIGSLLFS